MLEERMKGERLGEFEELILLAVASDANEATGVSIQEVLERDAGRPASLGAIYAALDRLSRKGMVKSWLGDPTPVRGGRRKRVYTVTLAGQRSAEDSKRVRERMWEKAQWARP
jgi:PadR family transcriptional regulator